MEWICAADELPVNDGNYLIVDLRYNRLKVSSYSKCCGTGSLFKRMPQNVLWAKFSIEEHNARIRNESVQSAKNAGGFYIYSTITL
jgi:hypothetical protein